MTRLVQPAEHAVPLGRVGEHDRHLPQRGGAVRRRRSSGALPRVRADVVVVATGGEERGLLTELCHEAEAEHVAVEGDRFRYRRHLQVDVAHDRAVGKLLERLRLGFGQLGEDAAHVERQRRHPLEDLPFPHLPRAVPVDLDAVPVRVAEVDRLAHEVIGEARQGHAVAPGVGEPAGEVDALGQQQGEVVKAGVAVRRLRAGLFHEHE